MKSKSQLINEYFSPLHDLLYNKGKIFTYSNLPLENNIEGNFYFVEGFEQRYIWIEN